MNRKQRRTQQKVIGRMGTAERARLVKEADARLKQIQALRARQGSNPVGLSMSQFLEELPPGSVVIDSVQAPQDEGT